MAASTITRFPTRKGIMKGRLKGLGISGFYGKAPIADLKAMGVNWVRVDVTNTTPTNAGIDELIDWYEGNGIAIEWLVSILPVVTHSAFTTPSALAQQIASRYYLKGLSTPMFELGNESIQLNVVVSSQPMVFTVTAANATSGAVYSNNGFQFTVRDTISGGTTLNVSTATGDPTATGTLTKVSGTGDATITFSAVTYSFATEALAETAYVNLISSWATAMQGYPHSLIACNDEPAYTLHTYQAVLAAAGVFPDAWGIHGYSISNGTPGANGPGTFDLMQEWVDADIIQTEGNYTAPTVSQANAVTYFTTMYNSMGTRPWAYYTLLSSSWNSTTNGYAWYNVESAPDSNGVPTASGRTATLLACAAAIGVTLP